MQTDVKTGVLDSFHRVCSWVNELLQTAHITQRQVEDAVNMVRAADGKDPIRHTFINQIMTGRDACPRYIERVLIPLVRKAQKLTEPPASSIPDVPGEATGGPAT